MKRIALLAIFSGLLMTSCVKKSTPVPDNSDLTIHFSSVADSKPVVNGALNYTNAAGNKYSITLLKYYVTNVVLVKEDNTEYKLNNYDLIDAFDPGPFSTVEASGVPNGHYNTIRFYLGVDKSRNHTGAQDGDLDPMYNMIWTWSTGYLFMKHEGNFINAAGDTTTMQYHLGTDSALSIIEIPISLDLEGSAKKLKLQFDLNKMYNSPVINFNDGAIHHSTLASDAPWIAAMVANSGDAFTYLGQE
ncbi:MAG: hypothetical protein JNJ58_09445 [Chitinophagaceae bacterium]|nr:hypothetical protein [Chitinophagaceae bacterium]